MQPFVSALLAILMISVSAGCSLPLVRRVGLSSEAPQPRRWADDAAEAPVSKTDSHGRTLTRSNVYNVMGQVERVERRGKLLVWSDAIDSAFSVATAVYFPAGTYWLERPIRLGDGQHLIADPGAHFRMLPNRNYACVQNRDWQKGNVDFSVVGGQWETGIGVGNGRGGGYGETAKAGQHGVFLFYKCSRFEISDLIIKKSIPFGIHITSCLDFVVQGIEFIDHRRDGVHVNGTSKRFIIRDISGVTHDDMLAFNAFEWKEYTPSDPTPVYGQISNGLVERVQLSVGCRLLTGNGYGVSNMVIRDIRGEGYFKIYEQSDQGASASNSSGACSDILFENIAVSPPLFSNIDRAIFDIAADIGSCVIRNVRVSDLAAHNVVAFGPKSAAISGREIFYPQRSYRAGFLLVDGVHSISRNANAAAASGENSAGHVVKVSSTAAGGVGTVGHLVLKNLNIASPALAGSGAACLDVDERAAVTLCELRDSHISGVRSMVETRSPAPLRLVESGVTWRDVPEPVAIAGRRLDISSKNLPIDISRVTEPGFGDLALNSNPRALSGVGLYVFDEASRQWRRRGEGRPPHKAEVLGSEF